MDDKAKPTILEKVYQYWTYIQLVGVVLVLIFSIIVALNAQQSLETAEESRRLAQEFLQYSQLRLGTPTVTPFP